MSGLATALSTIGVVLAVLVQIAALVWVLVKLEGRPRTFAAAGLLLLVVSTLGQAIWPQLVSAVAPGGAMMEILQAGWLVGNIVGLLGIVLLVAGVATGRSGSPQPHSPMPTPGFGPQNQMYGPGSAPPGV